jgi:hypothetical protein
MANAWGSRLHRLGAVGHLNRASGFGDWPEAERLVDELIAGSVHPRPADAPLPWLQLTSA